MQLGDSGPGWSEAAGAAGAAEPFETPLTTTKQQGSGMYVVRTAVQNHGGKIALGQSPLGGAEVKLTFQRVEKA